MVATIVSIALMAATATMPGPGVVPPADWGTGGPDAYGYTYIDSDEPGGPTYDWVEINGVGTQITGLGDDNLVGPFPIGFDFPYYWYTADQIYVGSNGYITFGDNTMAASPFPPIPGTGRPNNTLAPLLSDLDPSSGGTAWYWTNAAADTFIYEYDAVPFWSTGGSNTFQVILCKSDSTVTFQYKEQTGVPYNGWSPDNNQTGIENVSGSVGLNYLSGTVPPDNMYHDSLVVLFIPPESTNYEVHDASIRNAMNDRSGGIFVLNNQPVELWGVAENTGNQSESDFQSFVKVKRTNGSVLFFDSTMTSVPNPGNNDSLVFSSWTPTAAGVYIVEIYTDLPGDANPANDGVEVETHVVVLPGVLTYDNGTPGAYYSWNGPGGYGNRFVPPEYPCNVTGIRMNAQSATGVTVAFGLFDDNGQGGSPGDTLYITSVMVTDPTWYDVNLPTPVEITDGAFFVGAMSEVSSEPSYGMDTLPPFSGQTWEYTGVWAPSRDLWVRDGAFNAMVASTGIEEWITPELNPVTRIDVSPNPFGSSALIRLVNPRGSEGAVEVYDATGSLVRTVELVDGQAVLNTRDLSGRRLADGIYFARVTGTEAPVAKLIISR